MRKSSLTKYFAPANIACDNQSVISESEIPREPKPILKKRVGERPSSLGHQTSARQSIVNDLKRKSLTWGKSKVTEFLKEDRNSDGEIVNSPKTSARYQRARKGSIDHKQKNLLKITSQYELPIADPNHSDLIEENNNDIQNEQQIEVSPHFPKQEEVEENQKPIDWSSNQEKQQFSTAVKTNIQNETTLSFPDTTMKEDFKNIILHSPTLNFSGKRSMNTTFVSSAANSSTQLQKQQQIMHQPKINQFKNVPNLSNKAGIGIAFTQSKPQIQTQKLPLLESTTAKELVGAVMSAELVDQLQSSDSQECKKLVELTGAIIKSCLQMSISVAYNLVNSKPLPQTSINSLSAENQRNQLNQMEKEYNEIQQQIRNRQEQLHMFIDWKHTSSQQVVLSAGNVTQVTISNKEIKFSLQEECWKLISQLNSQATQQLLRQFQVEGEEGVVPVVRHIDDFFELMMRTEVLEIDGQILKCMVLKPEKEKILQLWFTFDLRQRRLDSKIKLGVFMSDIPPKEITLSKRLYGLVKGLDFALKQFQDL